MTKMSLLESYFVLV